MIHCPPRYDFKCKAYAEGVATITALNDAADWWLAERIGQEMLAYRDADRPGWRTVAGEPRFMLGLALTMVHAGLTCRNSYRVGALEG